MRRHKFELESTIADIRFLFFFVSNYTRIAAALVSCYGFIIVAAAVIVLGQGHCFCGLFYCPLKGYKAIYVRPYFYESCYPTQLYVKRLCIQDELVRMWLKAIQLK